VEAISLFRFLLLQPECRKIALFYIHVYQFPPGNIWFRSFVARSAVWLVLQRPTSGPFSIPKRKPGYVGRTNQTGPKGPFNRCCEKSKFSIVKVFRDIPIVGGCQLYQGGRDFVATFYGSITIIVTHLLVTITAKISISNVIVRGSMSLL